MAANLGRVGVWSMELRFGDHQAAGAAAAEVEKLGFGALWVPGGVDDTVLGAVDRLLDATQNAAVGTGIINIWKQTPEDVAAWWKSQSADRQARTLLGLGVSHAPLIGDDYVKPLAKMRDFLERADAAGLPRDAHCIAALAPKMLELSRDHSSGSHPYLVPAAHSAYARGILGPGKLLAPEQGVIMETDPDKARAIGRAHATPYMNLPNYVNNWRRMGFSEEDVKGSDKLIDAIFLWGEPERIKAGVQAHHDAGADHVCLQVIRGAAGGDMSVPMAEWQKLAKILL